MAATSCGIAVDDFALLEGYGESFDLDEIKSGAILDQIIQAGRDLLDVQLKDYLDKTVNGKGKYVPVIQDIIKKRLGPEVFEPNEIMRNDTRQIAKNMLTSMHGSMTVGRMSCGNAPSTCQRNRRSRWN